MAAYDYTALRTIYSAFGARGYNAGDGVPADAVANLGLIVGLDVALVGAVASTPPVLDVSNMFGATGNGVSDDTAAIQAALNAVPAGGGGVYLPAGTYIVNPGVGLAPKDKTTLFGDGYSSCIKVANGKNTTGNLLRVSLLTDVTLRDFRLDGNRANQAAGNNYGLFLDNCTNARVERVLTHGFTGVGFQAYGCTGAAIHGCRSWDNLYHGFECEQCRGCTWSGNSGYDNDRHGLFISPGEVGGTGSIDNMIIGNSFRTNDQYGIAAGEDAGGLSAYLSTGNIIAGNDVRANTIYGIQLWKVNGNIVTGNAIAGNGAFGVYLYRAAENQVTGNILTGNCQTADNSYDEIMLEGFADDATHPSRYNTIAYNTIRSTGTNQARYAVNEANAGDGPNTIVYNTTRGTFDTGTIRAQNTATVLSSPAGVLQVSGGQAIAGANAGIDNAFNILRVYSNLANSEIQVASGAGPIAFYTSGSNRMTLGAAGAIGFYGSSGVTQPTVTGSRGGNAALASLLTALANMGLIVNSSSA